jgi:hypothetical protein
VRSTSPVSDQALVESPDGDGVVVQAPAPIRGHERAVSSITLSVNGKSENPIEPVAGPSTASTSTANSTPAASSSSALPPVTPTPVPVHRKSSSFRHVPLRGSSTRSPLPSSPLRPPGTHSRTTSLSSLSTSRHFDQQTAPALPRPTPRSRLTSLASVHSTASASDDRPLPSIPSSSLETVYPERSATVPDQSSNAIIPPTRTPKPPPKLSQPQPVSQSPSPSVTPAHSSPAASPAPSLPNLPLTNTTATPALITRATAHYRPGFQPKGVYRPLTEEFTSLRKTHRDVGRIERTKLERRLEKLIQLHFSTDGGGKKQRPAVVENRRASGFFDLDLSDLRNMDAGELWRGVIQSQAVQGVKADTRGWCICRLLRCVLTFLFCSC